MENRENGKPPVGWGVPNIPNLAGKTAIVTGATGGLGYIIARELAAAQCIVILGGRNTQKGQEAVENIKRTIGSECVVSFALIDQSQLKSVQKFAEKIVESGEKLDILINNAGVMAPPLRKTTSDGFELQLGTNHLSHFALTALLLPALRRSPCPRVVNVSSRMANRGMINMDDLNSEQSYSPWAAYEQSKLANLLFTVHLQEKSDEGGWGLCALAAHPGLSSTNIVDSGPGKWSLMGQFLYWIGYPLFSQSNEKASLSILYAATASNVLRGGYYGFEKFFETRGKVAQAWMPLQAQNGRLRAWLWEKSEKMTGITFPTESFVSKERNVDLG